MELNDRYLYDYCDVYDSEQICSAAPFYLVACTCSNTTMPIESSLEINSFETLGEVWHIFWTIVPTLIFFAIARVLGQSWSLIANVDSVVRFAIEFLIITVPVVVSVNVANAAVEYFVAILALCLILLFGLSHCYEKASSRMFAFGSRPTTLTLARATINYLTALCILAIDFESFPREFRKTRRFGAGLMDVGIGLFVFAMGTVSKRLRRKEEIFRLMRAVLPVLFLGLARTVVIMCIDYHQDEHEYGVHLNAFFTLGLTKLFGGAISSIATSDVQLLPLGLCILAIHEITLQLGISNYVMSNSVVRDTFVNANREGLCSLPGFIGLYLVSMFIGRWIQSKDYLSCREFIRKMTSMAILSSGIWVITITCIFTVGIARVTCNFGYVAWIFGIAATMVLLYMFVFDFVLNTIWPLDEQMPKYSQQESGDMNTEHLLKKANAHGQMTFPIPTLVEAVNQNGLLFFLVANILTGGVNIFLKPENRTNMESVGILTVYMLCSTGFVYILYRLKIRIV